MTLEGEWKYHMIDVEPLIVGRNKSQVKKDLFFVSAFKLIKISINFYGLTWWEIWHFFNAAFLSIACQGVAWKHDLF